MHLTRADVERHVVERDDAAEPLGDALGPENGPGRAAGAARPVRLHQNGYCDAFVLSTSIQALPANPCGLPGMRWMFS